MYDLLHEQWLNVRTSFYTVWAEGLDLEETAARIGVNPDDGAVVSLSEITGGIDEDPHWRDGAGVVLIGEADDDSWTVSFQVQGGDIAGGDLLARLSAGGGRALSIGWNINANHRLEYAVDGDVAVSVPLHEALPHFDEHAAGLSMPDVWNEDGDFPIEEMISTGFQLAQRITGVHLDRYWLRLAHTRFVLPY
ncbi:DUF6461 domain-containing protein [Nonomuraea ceibae]|uniref:DUF6461 domain-containing protein n=1 Tax=Nonomuraea ceibae TaxID=1935170 RepID=UPI001C5F4BC3|nr:DUF6461 domain-containing protein [Nonomuraea ceibae]